MRAGPCALLLCLGGVTRASHADPARYDLRVEDGVEYDSNPARAEQISGLPPSPAAPGSLLTRVVMSGDLAVPLGHDGSNVLVLSPSLGGKWFVATEARAESVLVAQALASDTMRLAQRAQLVVAAVYYDVYQRRATDLPDFRSTAPSLRLDYAMWPAVTASAALGYRWFTYKPDDALSFTAPTAQLLVRHVLAGGLWDGGADWEWSAGGSLEARAFHGPACSATSCDDLPQVPRQHDRFWILHAELTRTSSWLFGSGAALHLNQSNSYGESLLRGLVHVRAVVPLPWQWSLSLRAEIVATSYAEPVVFTQTVSGLPSASIDDESRSTLRAELARLCLGQVEIGTRYVYYTSAPTSYTVKYRRQTLLVYLAVAAD
ncbi:MAG: hypothetical protein ABSB49_08535 [Polyangia bacterium]